MGTLKWGVVFQVQSGLDRLQIFCPANSFSIIGPGSSPSLVFPPGQPVAGVSWGQAPGIPVQIDFPPEAPRSVARESPNCGGTRHRVCFVGVEFLDGAQENLNNQRVGVQWEKP